MVSVNGVSGSGCRQLSAAIEKALGVETNVELTAEYYQIQEEHNDNTVQG